MIQVLQLTPAVAGYLETITASWSYRQCSWGCGWTRQRRSLSLSIPIDQATADVR